MTDAMTQIATLLGIVAGDRYQGEPPPMPELNFSMDASTSEPAVGGEEQGTGLEAVGRAAYAAGFRGEALATIIAIAGRESGGNPGALGDVKLQDATWGPSVGAFQIRTLKGQTGTGSARDISRLQGNLTAQAQAAWELSSQGTNFGPWRLHGGSWLDRTNIAGARRIAALIEGGASG